MGAKKHRLILELLSFKAVTSHLVQLTEDMQRERDQKYIDVQKQQFSGCFISEGAVFKGCSSMDPVCMLPSRTFLSLGILRFVSIFLTAICLFLAYEPVP